MARDEASGSPGPSTDRHNDPVADPTWNVKDLVDAAIQRQDDLREMESNHIRELGRLRAAHDRELREAEAKRIDAIRAVDVGQVASAAQTVASSAEALRSQVAATAAAFDIKLGAVIDPIQKRIDDLTRAQFQAEGQKTQVVETRATGANTGLWIGVAFGALSLVLAIAAMGFSIYIGTR